MISIFLAVFFTIVSAIAYKSIIAVLASGVSTAICALIVNYIFKPNALNEKFVKTDFVCTDIFPLEVISDDGGNPIYVIRGKDKNRNDIVAFKSIGRNNAPSSIKRVPRSMTHIIYDDVPMVKLYSAIKHIKGDKMLSIFSSKAIQLVIELHTPDSFAAFSTDEAF